MPEIKNREELIEKLTDMLIEFDKEENSYQTDVYMYYDKTAGTAYLDTFVNVGGNSWLNDDHILIYSDKQHSDSGIQEYYQDTEYIADALEISPEQLYKETAEYEQFSKEDIEEGVEPDWYEVWRYVCNEKKHGYKDKLYEQYNAFLEENRSEYAQTASEIISPIKLIYYGNEVCRYEDDTIVLIDLLDISDDERDLLNEYCEKYSETMGDVSYDDIKDHLEYEDIFNWSLDGNLRIDTQKLKTLMEGLEKTKTNKDKGTER